MPSPHADLTVPRGRSHASAWQRGYDARLGGVSKYANPYGDAIERHDYPYSGWLHTYFQSWLRGWLAADHLLGEDT